MARLSTYDVVSWLWSPEVGAEMRRVLNRYLYNWAREGKITNYGTDEHALWDTREVLDQYARFVAPYRCGGEARSQSGSECG